MCVFSTCLSWGQWYLGDAKVTLGKTSCHRDDAVYSLVILTVEGQRKHMSSGRGFEWHWVQWQEISRLLCNQTGFQTFCLTITLYNYRDPQI